MIGSLRGAVVERTLSGEVLIEVGGVGYRVHVPVGAVPALEPGAAAYLFTHQHVREDALILYGFPTRDERDTFEALITASGVGPKLALKPFQVWGIRIRLQVGNRMRDLALFDLALDSKLRGCDLIQLRVSDLMSASGVKRRVVILQQKTGRPVQFEVTEQARRS